MAYLLSGGLSLVFGFGFLPSGVLLSLTTLVLLPIVRLESFSFSPAAASSCSQMRAVFATVFY